MAAPAKCIEPGCTKFRVKNKRCVKHNKEFLAREAEAAIESGAAPGGAIASEESPAATEPSTGEAKSLLALVKGKQADRPGFFLDFTSHEDLLERVLAASEDLNGEILVLLSALLDGKLQSEEDVFGVLYERG